MVISSRTFPLTRFVGRASERTEVAGLVGQHRLVTLVGTGGLGKTRLAYEVFDEVSHRFPGRAWFVELAGLHDPRLVPQVVADALGVRTPGPDPEALAAAVGHEPAVLLIDNCEHLLEASAELLWLLLSRCPDLHVLATSRQPLGVLGERQFEVPPLPASEAVDLFLEGTSAVSPGWDGAPRERAAIADICRALDGVPLAIELAATRMRVLGAEQIRDQLQHELAGISVTSLAGERHRSMHTCLQWSYDLCGDDARQLWMRLSVFADGFALDAARSVAASDALDADRVSAVLGELLMQSIVVRDGQGPENRFRMLEPVRQFGEERLREHGLGADVEQRHLDFYVGLVERFEAEWHGPGQATWMQRWRAEHANLRLAFELGFADPDTAPKVLRMSSVLEHYFASRGGGNEAVRWLSGALAHGVGEERVRAAALRTAVFVACVSGDLGAAEELFGVLADLDAASTDRQVHGWTLYAEAVLRTWQGDAARGARIAEEGVAVLREVGDVAREANLHFLRGMMLGWSDQADAAGAAYQACLDLSQPAGEHWLASYAQWGLGVDRLMADRVEEALRLERDALRTKLEFEDPLGVGLALEALAWAATRTGDHRRAWLLTGAAEAIWSDIGTAVAGMPYLVRQREAAWLTLDAPEEKDRDQWLAFGRSAAIADVAAIALDTVAVPPLGPRAALTRREREIAIRVAEGDSNKAIAGLLFISVRTVESHVESILRKLGVPSRAQVGTALAAASGPSTPRR